MSRWLAAVVIVAVAVAVSAAHIWCGIQERKEGMDPKDDNLWSD